MDALCARNRQYDRWALHAWRKPGTASDTAVLSVVHRGLTSETGQNNCFLNVIIQSLWHLASFREALLGCDPAAVPAPGAPPADARVLTALRNIFRAFQQVRVNAAGGCTEACRQNG